MHLNSLKYHWVSIKREKLLLIASLYCSCSFLLSVITSKDISSLKYLSNISLINSTQFPILRCFQREEGSKFHSV